ncbi:MAG: FHA domain-containing protein [Rhodobacterales bacterium]|nr:FHA domain-containing protein [Rhodobacterales bacterium]
MATLRELNSGEVQTLPGRLLVGRSPSCGLRLDDRTVSGEHALLSWTDSEWRVRDLGSRNGTFVGGLRVPPGEGRQLKSGDQLGFGDEVAKWELLDDGAPSALAQSVDGALIRVAQDGILALPNPESPKLVVYLDDRARWISESDVGQVDEVVDGQVLRCDDQGWRLSLPVDLEGTATVEAGMRLDAIRLRFAVSLDEEHVTLTVIYRGTEVALEAREHLYVLLTLARARVSDSDQSLSEQGWLDRDRLLKMLAVDANAMNVAIYRARGQLSAAGVDGAAAVVQVRRGQRRLGLEPDRIEIVAL